MPYSILNEAKEDHELGTNLIDCRYSLGLTHGMFMMQLLADHSMVPCMPKEECYRCDQRTDLQQVS